MAVIEENLPSNLAAVAAPVLDSKPKRTRARKEPGVTTTTDKQPRKRGTTKTMPVISPAALAEAEAAQPAEPTNGYVTTIVPPNVDLLLGAAEIVTRPSTEDEIAQRDGREGVVEILAGQPTYSADTLETIADGMHGDRLPFEPNEADISEMRAEQPDVAIEPEAAADDSQALLEEGLALMRQHGEVEERDGMYYLRIGSNEHAEPKSAEEVIAFAQQIRDWRAEKEAEVTAPEQERAVGEPVEVVDNANSPSAETQAAITTLRALDHTVQKHGIHWLVRAPEQAVPTLVQDGAEMQLLADAAEANRLESSKALLRTIGELEGEAAPYSFFPSTVDTPEGADQTISFMNDQELIAYADALRTANAEGQAPEAAAEPKSDLDQAIEKLGTVGTVEVVTAGERWRFTPEGEAEGTELDAAELIELAASVPASEPAQAEPTAAAANGKMQQLPLEPKREGLPLGFEILRENFLAGVKQAMPAVAGKSTLPVLTNIRIESFMDGRVQLQATNLEVGLTIDLSAKVSLAGATTMPAKLLLDVLGKLTGEVLIVDVDPRTQTMSYRCQKEDKRWQEGRLKGIEADEFPNIPIIGEEVEAWTIDSGLLMKSVIAHTLPAVATDDTRPVLAGLHLAIKKGKLLAEGADGFRANRLSIDIGGSKRATADVIVPGRALKVLAKLLDDEQKVEVKVAPSGGQIAFQCDNIILVSRLIEGTYADVGRIVPASFLGRAVVNREELQNAVELAMLYASTSAKIVRVKISEGMMEITGEGAEVGDGKSTLGAMVAISNEHTELKIALNGLFLLDEIGCLTTEKIAIELQEQTNPAVFKEVGGEGDFVGIVMPMTVR